jgi:hypothetical protein
MRINYLEKKKISPLLEEEEEEKAEAIDLMERE